MKFGIIRRKLTVFERNCRFLQNERFIHSKIFSKALLQKRHFTVKIKYLQKNSFDLSISNRLYECYNFLHNIYGRCHKAETEKLDLWKAKKSDSWNEF